MTYASYAFLAGAAIALQATMNARLGVLLNSSLAATATAFFFRFLIMVAAYSLTSENLISTSSLKSVPWYLWFGGLFSAFGVGMFYFLIPKMGVCPMMSLALTGQLIIAITSSHYGFFNLPIQQINPLKIVGVVLLIVGIVLINKEHA
jgi:transporter family-2 protein